jgi:hypothetical protein
VADDEFTAPDSPEELFGLKKTPPFEAASDWRTSAANLHEFYVALCAAGFTETQSLGFISVIVQTAATVGFGNGSSSTEQ